MSISGVIGFIGVLINVYMASGHPDDVLLHLILAGLCSVRILTKD